MEYLEKLTALRKEQGLSIGKLTSLAGLSENTIYNWYKKDKNIQPTVYTLKAVCDVLGVSLSCFFAENEKEYLSSQEERLLAAFSKLNEKQRALYLELIEEFTGTPKTKVKDKTDECRF